MKAQRDRSNLQLDGWRVGWSRDVLGDPYFAPDVITLLYNARSPGAAADPYVFGYTAALAVRVGALVCAGEARHSSGVMTRSLKPEFVKVDYNPAPGVLPRLTEVYPAANDYLAGHNVSLWLDWFVRLFAEPGAWANQYGGREFVRFACELDILRKQIGPSWASEEDKQALLRSVLDALAHEGPCRLHRAFIYPCVVSPVDIVAELRGALSGLVAASSSVLVSVDQATKAEAYADALDRAKKLLDERSA